jgi:hypothetical protein
MSQTVLYCIADLYPGGAKYIVVRTRTILTFYTVFLSLQANVRTVSLIWPQPLPPSQFIIHNYHTMVLHSLS